MNIFKKLTNKISDFMFKEYDACFKNMGHVKVTHVTLCEGKDAGKNDLSPMCKGCPYFILTDNNRSKCFK